MKNLMIDSETLGMDDDAVIVQIAMVEFDATMQTVNKICVNIDPVQMLLDGFTTTPLTLQWWNDQSQVVKDRVLFAETVAPNAAARMLSEWVTGFAADEEFTIWAQGPIFDIPKVDHFMSHYNQVDLSSRTSYRNIRDLRTVIATAMNIDSTAMQAKLKIISREAFRAHTALDDCLIQIMRLDAAMSVLIGANHATT